MMRKLDGERITGILNNHLFRYLDFTAKLEIVVVNDVMSQLIFGQTPIAFDEEMQIDALKIYTDEGYHALFSMDLFHQARTLMGVDPIVPTKPAFMRDLHKLINECGSEREKRLTKLFFVATSETLITSSLTEIRKANDVPDAVRKTITDHAMDEARHHIFFRELIEVTWSQLEQADRDRIIRQFPDFILAFVQPDRDAIRAELAANGLKHSEAEIVFEETYTADVVSRYARLCATSLLELLQSMNEFKNESVHELYDSKGLLK